jgi:hypothetical protein
MEVRVRRIMSMRPSQAKALKNKLKAKVLGHGSSDRVLAQQMWITLIQYPVPPISLSIHVYMGIYVYMYICNKYIHIY